MQGLRALAAGQGGVFTVADAVSTGIGPGRARTLITHRDWVPVRRGVYVEQVVAEAAALDPRIGLALDTAAALRAYGPGRLATAHSAACLFGLELLGDIPRRPSLIVPRAGSDDPACTGRGYRKRGPRTLVSHLPDEQRGSAHGLPCVSLARAAADLARVAPLAVGVVAMDSAARQFGLTQDAVREAVALQRGWPYARRASAAAEWMDERSESVLESFGRVALRGTDLPALVCQAWVGERSPEFRVDLLIPGLGLVGEGDGRRKYADPATLWAEKKRQERIEELGGVVVRFDWMDAEHPAELAARFRAAADRARRLSGADRRLRIFPDPAWWVERRRRTWAEATAALSGIPWWLRDLPGYQSLAFQARPVESAPNSRSTSAGGA